MHVTIASVPVDQVAAAAAAPAGGLTPLAFAGAAIGAVGALVAVYLKEFFARLALQRTLALAISAEVSAVTSVVKMRRYAENIRAEIEKGKQGQAMYLPPIGISRDYFPVTGKVAEKIGALPPHLAHAVVTYYVWANAFVEDATFDRGNGGHYGPGDVEQVQETLHVLEQTFAMAEFVVALVQKDYPVGVATWRSAAAALRRGWRELVG